MPAVGLEVKPLLEVPVWRDCSARDWQPVAGGQWPVARKPCSPCLSAFICGWL